MTRAVLVLLVAAAVVATVKRWAWCIAFMWAFRVRVRRIRRLMLAGRNREAERVLSRLDVECSAFKARHPAWCRT